MDFSIRACMWTERTMAGPHEDQHQNKAGHE